MTLELWRKDESVPDLASRILDPDPPRLASTLHMMSFVDCWCNHHQYLHNYQLFSLNKYYFSQSLTTVVCWRPGIVVVEETGGVILINGGVGWVMISVGGKVAVVL